ncbi:MAG TPA: hypothetical protein VG275_06990 [Solirubrobacteraceae bacterium]|jgi:hypothetical protein|nr:hypothetical protein [Solirubrobacteraceae bacterium]
MGAQGHEAEVWAEIAARGEDIGHGVVIRYYGGDGSQKAGILLYHQHSDGAVCGGSVAFAMPHGAPSKPSAPGKRALWKVEALEPLTLSPSIFDPSCGLHGHIVRGAWVPC